MRHALVLERIVLYRGLAHRVIARSTLAPFISRRAPRHLAIQLAVPKHLARQCHTRPHAPRLMPHLPLGGLLANASCLSPGGQCAVQACVHQGACLQIDACYLGFVGNGPDNQLCPSYSPMALHSLQAIGTTPLTPLGVSLLHSRSQAITAHCFQTPKS